MTDCLIFLSTFSLLRFPFHLFISYLVCVCVYVCDSMSIDFDPFYISFIVCNRIGEEDRSAGLDWN
jgi:hypothetical protein